jgi:hypothetical protein
MVRTLEQTREAAQTPIVLPVQSRPHRLYSRLSQKIFSTKTAFHRGEDSPGPIACNISCPRQSFHSGRLSPTQGTSPTMPSTCWSTNIKRELSFLLAGDPGGILRASHRLKRRRRCGGPRRRGPGTLQRATAQKVMPSELFGEHIAANQASAARPEAARA